jgi:hypothetical protein
MSISCWPYAAWKTITSTFQTVKFELIIELETSIRYQNGKKASAERWCFFLLTKDQIKILPIEINLYGAWSIQIPTRLQTWSQDEVKVA